MSISKPVLTQMDAGRYRPADPQIKSHLPDLISGVDSFLAPSQPPVLSGDAIAPEFHWASVVQGSAPMRDSSIEERASLAAQMTEGMHQRFQIQLFEGHGGELVMVHGAGPLTSSFERLKERWKSSGVGALKLIGTCGDVYHEFLSLGSLGNRDDLPLMQRAFRTLQGAPIIDPFALHSREIDSLGNTSEVSPAAAMLGRLAAVPTPLEETQRLNELEQLGVLSPLAKFGLEYLRGRFSQTQLSTTTFCYSGHALFSMLPMTWAATRLFPANSLKIMLSSYSGSTESIAFHKLLLRKQDGIYQKTGDNPMRSDSIQAYAQKLRARLAGSGAKVQEAVTIWDKPPNAQLHAQNTATLRAGNHRYIIHNADDKHLRELNTQGILWAVDLAKSKSKALEARFIGEQYALMAARDVRQYWQATLRDCQVRVLGGGLLGGNVVDALLRIGFPKSKIVVIDKDENTLNSFAKRGVLVSKPENVGDSFERTVCFVATASTIDTEEALRLFGPQSVVYGLNSGGKLFAERIEQFQIGPEKILHSHQPYTDPQQEIVSNDSSKVYKDRKYEIELRAPDGSFSRRQMTLIADGFPANLLHEQWSDRYQITAMAVLGCYLQAAAMEHAGIQPLAPEFDQFLIHQAEQSGLLKPRPLNPRYGESSADLLDDLRAMSGEEIFQPTTRALVDDGYRP